MKKIMLNLAGIILAISFSISLTAQTFTPGTLTFTFTPVSHNGYSGTKNVLAVWIQTGTGEFVKTKIRFVGGGTDDHLPIWGENAGCSNPFAVTSSSCNTTDAVTGATLGSFTTRTIIWDGKNVNGTSNGTTVADGTYKVTIEECWNHGTSGKTTISYMFTKGPNADNQKPANSTHFTDISLDWLPSLSLLSATTTTTNATFGNCNGTATVNASGGQSPYTYAWSTTPAQTSAMATGLCGGTYSVTVTDSLLNTFVSSATVIATGTGLSCSATSTNATASTCNGTATANATGGQTPYTYKWSTTPTQTSMTATGLCAGTYTVSVTDAASGTDTAMVTVMSVVSTIQLTEDSLVKIYPNPTNGIISLGFKQATGIIIENSIGEIVYEEKIKQGTTEIKNLDLSNFPSGNYFICIMDGEKSSKYKVVLNK